MRMYQPHSQVAQALGHPPAVFFNQLCLEGRSRINQLCLEAGLPDADFDVVLRGVETGRIEAIIRNVPAGGCRHSPGKGRPSLHMHLGGGGG
jgi:hypothetical protein